MTDAWGLGAGGLGMGLAVGISLLAPVSGPFSRAARSAAPVSVDLRATPTQSGARLRLSVARRGRTVRRFAMVDERPMQLFVIGADLAFFAHEQPLQQPDGVFMIDVALPKRGPYMAIAEFRPEDGTPQTVQRMFTTGEAFTTAPLPAVDVAAKTVDGVRVSIDASRIAAGEVHPVVVRLADAATSAPVTDLQPYLGAVAHLLLVPMDVSEAIHARAAGTSGGPDLTFTPLVPRPGRYKLWVQFRRADKVSTAPFVIEPPAAAAAARDAATIGNWSAVPGYGAFANDPSLAAAERALAGASIALPIPASAADATVRVAARWIGGWDVEPGDPLVTSMTFTSAGGAPLGTWVAGDAPVRFPAGSGMRVTSPIHVAIQRRALVTGEAPRPARRSVLRLIPRAAAPARRVWVERRACGEPRTGRPSHLLAVRPLLADGASARMWIERPGSPQVIVGWFRDVASLYLRAFWLARPVELTPESRLASDVSCAVELTLASR